MWLWSSGAVFPAFWSLSCFALVVLLANMALFGFLRGFLARFVGLCGFVLSWRFAWLVGLLCA